MLTLHFYHIGIIPEIIFQVIGLVIGYSMLGSDIVI